MSISPKASAAPARSRPEIIAMPDWLRRPIGKASELSTVQKVIKQRNIHTI
ncbi:MAG: lipoyl synthase, partial [Cyanobacteria bacterium J06648_10]